MRFAGKYKNNYITLRGGASTIDAELTETAGKNFAARQKEGLDIVFPLWYKK